MVRHRVRLLQRLRHARAVDAVRVVAALIDVWTLRFAHTENVGRRAGCPIRDGSCIPWLLGL